MKQMNVLVTGGAGFIGSSLSYELANDNNVIIIDDLSTGKEENIAELATRENVKFIRTSILDLDRLQEIFKGVDYVFHQAAIPSVPRSIDDPLTSNNVNITGTLNVLLAARDNKVKKVVMASSSSVYGDTPTLPKQEDMPATPQSPYALTKLVDEQYCQFFCDLYGLPTACLRYFNIYGPRQDPNSQYSAVIPVFITLLNQDKPVVIYGDGKQTRDFTFVMDAVQANIKAAESDATGVYNVGAGSRISVNELAETIMASMGKKLAPVYKERRAGDVMDSLADISKAKAFGYQPDYDLEKGLKVTIDSFIH